MSDDSFVRSFVRTFLKPWNEHDVDGAMALMTDDCLWEVTRGAEAHVTRFEGSTAVRAAIGGAFQAMPDIRYELVRSSFGPDLVVVELLVMGTPVNGAAVRFHACDVMTLRSGKVATKRSY